MRVTPDLSATWKDGMSGHEATVAIIEKMMGMCDFNTMMCGLLVSCTFGGKLDSEMMKVLSGHKQFLPKPVENTIDALKNISAMQETAATIREGTYKGGLIDLTITINQVMDSQKSANDVCKARGLYEYLCFM